MKARIVIIIGAVLVLLAGVLSYVYFGGRDGAKVLASVNGEKITVGGFLREMEKIQGPDRDMFKEDPAKFLDMMITKSLVLQEAKMQDTQTGNENKDEEALIQEFLQKRFSSPPAVSKEELEAFYEIYKDRMEGRTLEQVAPMIEQIIMQHKREEEYMRFLEGLRSNAAIEINQERLKGLAVAAKPAELTTNTEEELAGALDSGRPTLVDFGSNSCIPCRQLRPILQEIKKEQEGKLEVLVIDIYKHQDLAGRYRIQVMPTLIFFDSTGKEVVRRQGFMPKAALMEELKKVGIS